MSTGSAGFTVQHFSSFPSGEKRCARPRDLIFFLTGRVSSGCARLLSVAQFLADRTGESRSHRAAVGRGRNRVEGAPPHVPLPSPPHSDWRAEAGLLGVLGTLRGPQYSQERPPVVGGACLPVPAALFWVPPPIFWKEEAGKGSLSVSLKTFKGSALKMFVSKYVSRNMKQTELSVREFRKRF